MRGFLSVRVRQLDQEFGDSRRTGRRGRVFRNSTRAIWQWSRQILEKAAAGGAGRNAIDQKIGDLYGSCMDEKAADAKGIAPLKPELERIAAVKDKGALIERLPTFI